MKKIGEIDRKCSWAEIYRSLESINTENLVRDRGVAEIIASKRLVKVVSGNIAIYLVGVSSHIHMVLPRIYCSCADFSINVVSRCLKPFCVHLAAAELAERKKLYKEIYLDSEGFSKVVASILEGEVSPYISI
jgi:predicted nucleic acid-binding Zn finger protein